MDVLSMLIVIQQTDAGKEGVDDNPPAQPAPCSFRWFSQMSSHPAVFFSHNKPANSAFSHNNPAKRTCCRSGSRVLKK
jgi:hypothetical protein